MYNINNIHLISTVSKKISNIFKKNQLVVHEQYGIGKYIKLSNIKVKNKDIEYVVIMYAKNTKLYVPITSINLIYPYYTSNNSKVLLNSLNNNIWKKEKKEIAKKVYNMALKLMNLYLERFKKKGFSFKINYFKYQKFCQGFPFKATKDQENAINQVFLDMNKNIPMDRVICGDVGFGKTEIAIRATYIALENKKQVAILVPTTLLVKQHYNTFKNRFSKYPYIIKTFSRFTGKKKVLKIINDINTGKIQILIGTHKILSKNILWHDLGLLIVDEEHRFGVLHKEKIKEMYINVDILTLSATPIPRTLYMSMINLKDLSILSTPPKGRLSIGTFVKPYNTKIIRKIILKEVARGGQVFYLFNNIKNINIKFNCLSKLIPEVRIKIGHGQMNGKILNSIIKDFLNKSFDVLISTTIIDTGLDISNVNLIIVENADKFGLSQLHQLRGRVGRSNKKSNAWFFVSNIKNINIKSKERLKAIMSYKSLGSGYILSQKDSKIRGVGELLGKDQSGNIKKIGSYLYTKFFSQIIKLIKKNKNLSLESFFKNPIDIKIHVSALFPKKYILNDNIRLYYYIKIASSQKIKDINFIQIELIKKFGKLPYISENLLFLSKIRILSEKLKIKKIKFYKKEGYICFSKKNIININQLLKIVFKYPKIFKILDYSLFFKKKFLNDTICLNWIFNKLYFIYKNCI